MHVRLEGGRAEYVPECTNTEQFLGSSPTMLAGLVTGFTILNITNGRQLNI